MINLRDILLTQSPEWPNKLFHRICIKHLYLNHPTPFTLQIRTMNITQQASNMLGSVYCPSSYSSSYSYTCPDCCCYSGNDSKFPYCCSCASDFIWLWIVLTVVFAAVAFGIVKFIQTMRRRRHMEIQVNYTRIPNQFAAQPQNYPPNQGNNIVIHSNNQPNCQPSYQPNYQPNNHGQYRPPVMQPQHQPQYQPPVQNNQQGQVQEKYRAPNAFQNQNGPNLAAQYSYGHENKFEVRPTLKTGKQYEVLPSQDQLINEDSKNSFKEQEHQSKQGNDYPKI